MTANTNLQAAALALAASAILSLIDNFVASIAEEAGLWQFQIFRTLFALPLLVLLGRTVRVSVAPKHWGRLALRSAFVSAGLLLYFASLGTLPVAQAGAGLFSAPIWVLLLSFMVFGARIGGLRVLAVIGGFAGALMVLRPDAAALSVMAVLPLAAGALYGFGMLLTREFCAHESPVALAFGVFATIGLFSLGLVCVTALAPGETFLTRPWAPVTFRFLWLTLFQAAGAVIAVTLIAQAYRIGRPANVAVYEYSFLVFAAFWGLALWGTATDVISWIGIGIIIVSGLVVARLPDVPMNQAARIRS
ncbi:DMT family transporter [Shinella sp. 838]|uniref:DMT family transporter n=1 Tax=Shinella sp. 838 TaxID=3038164 RepID=UPI00241520F9|nr:DMT family transporter [Shinella sp. 838]MDG4674884.1 DMT family transporter [Shinella sp. 838]